MGGKEGRGAIPCGKEGGRRTATRNPMHSGEGEVMKKSAIVALAMLFGLSLAWTAFGAEKATKEECVAKTKEAAKLYSEKGEAEAIKEINNKQGKFVWKDTYVFMTDFDGKMLAHPMSPALIGKNVLDMKDKGTPGKLLFKEFTEVAKSKGEGWVDYMWINPGDPAPRKKVTYVYRVPGKNVYVGAGIYE
jgi:signal transduction histidine kinase